ncbi:hypothetical protein KOR42_46020 [Thalassoglobus neptunius]|uniref:Uncharacterized protein n=1 Tax=Thalassoglobus neptunius TaxID=1938619 RepID=A0A5C5VZS6_9PLAN|nr:hypothetical protein [Thalassoglobus neptunius]TWT43002.1 hypothetical protein KOR42_46020 [Thalassoglobus neptunius]
MKLRPVGCLGLLFLWASLGGAQNPIPPETPTKVEESQESDSSQQDTQLHPVEDPEFSGCDCLCPIQSFGTMGDQHFYYYLCCDNEFTRPGMPSDFRESDDTLVTGCNQAPGQHGQCAVDGPDCVEKEAIERRNDLIEWRRMPRPSPACDGSADSSYSEDERRRGQIHQSEAVLIDLEDQPGFDRIVKLVGHDQEAEIYFRLVGMTSKYISPRGTEPITTYGFAAFETDPPIDEESYPHEIREVVLTTRSDRSVNGDRHHSHRLNILSPTRELSESVPRDQRSYAWAVSEMDLSSYYTE